MAYSSEQAQEKRRSFLDPRTKLAIVLILAVFVMGGLGKDQVKPIKTVLSVLPFFLLLAERQWKRFARGAAMLVIGYGLLAAMPHLPGEKLHMPQAITIPMSVMFRLFPTIGSEWRSIRRAMTIRGIHLGGARAGQVLEYQLVPMMTSTVRIGEELSASALTRGLGAPVRRTNICRIGFRVQDAILLIGCLFVIAVWILELCGVNLW